MSALLLLLALATPAERWGVDAKDAAFSERIEKIAEEGANTRRARAYLNEFAKKPDSAVLRGLGWVLERKESTPQQRRNAHVLLLILTGSDVATPDADVWFGIVDKLQRGYRKPPHPSKGEVRAAVLLGALALYRHMDEHGALRVVRQETQTKQVPGPPSIALTCEALLALHACGLPKNDPALHVWLAQCRAWYGSKHYEKLQTKDIRFGRTYKGWRSYCDTAFLAWANAELGGEPVSGIDKELYRLLDRHTRISSGYYITRLHVLLALRAMTRAGQAIDPRPVARYEAWRRKALKKALPDPPDQVVGLQHALAPLAVAILIQRPGSTAKELRADPLFATYLKRYPTSELASTKRNWHYSHGWESARELHAALDAREMTIGGQRVDVLLHDVGIAVRAQAEDGMFLPQGGWLGMSPEARTARVLLSLAGGLSTATAARVPP